MKFLTDRLQPNVVEVIVPEKDEEIPKDGFMKTIDHVPENGRILDMQPFFDQPSHELYESIVHPYEDVFLLKPKGGNILLDEKGGVVKGEENQRKIYIAVSKLEE